MVNPRVSALFILLRNLLSRGTVFPLRLAKYLLESLMFSSVLTPSQGWTGYFKCLYCIDQFELSFLSCLGVFLRVGEAGRESEGRLFLLDLRVKTCCTAWRSRSLEQDLILKWRLALWREGSCLIGSSVWGGIDFIGFYQNCNPELKQYCIQRAPTLDDQHIDLLLIS